MNYDWCVIDDWTNRYAFPDLDYSADGEYEQWRDYCYGDVALTVSYVKKLISGRWYVIHVQSGCSLPYIEQRSKEKIPDYKWDVFQDWHENYGSKKRKKLEKMFTTPMTGCDVKKYPFKAYNTAATATYTIVDLDLDRPATYADMGVLLDKSNNEKETTMYLDTRASLDMQKKQYLLNRLDNEHRKMVAPLSKTFGLSDDTPPKTPSELVERIQAGKFVIPSEEDQKKRRYYGPEDAIYSFRWRDPAAKEDQAGYEAAEKALTTAYTEAKDAIMIKSDEDGLKALEDFKSKTFH